GFSVAPFKSQNMSLNSYACASGGEMGRAQVVQAEAAGIEPRVDMNPVLLKPTTETGAQVIVQGRPVATMTALDYHDYKMGLLDAVSDSLERLRRDFEIVVIEGAGSPAEVNFRGRDIANMAVAEIADAPVLLAGDIERGGVFASLVGTMELLEEEERERVRGLIINKFRGDRSILEPGLDFLEARCHRPVLGVIPYIRDLRIEEEDSVALSREDTVARALWPSDVRDAARDNGHAVKVKVVRLPRISNFTDFDSLKACPGFDVSYAEHAAALADADLLIIPGTKSTIADLRFLWSSGMAAEIIRKARAGVPVIGICGGYQMLGRSVHDPDGIDSQAGTVKALGLLDIVTTFSPEKDIRQAQGRIAADNALIAAGASVEGYEIHMGRSVLGDGVEPLMDTEHGVDGAVSEDGLVLGSYLHGFFDSDDVLSGLLAYFGCPTELPLISRDLMKEHEYDRLARELRQALDMEKVYEIMGIRG
ncbi:MAG: cobyric acid synthase, partial [Thermoleophilia bacterium]